MEGVERLWTHEETAQFLHVSMWRLHHLVVADAGPAMYWVGSQRRYDPVEVRAWLRQQATPSPTAPSSAAKATQRSRSEPSDRSDQSEEAGRSGRPEDVGQSAQGDQVGRGRHVGRRHARESALDLPAQVAL